MDDIYDTDTELDEFSDVETDEFSWGRQDAICDVARWLADDWKIKSRETLPKIFPSNADQTLLWERVLTARVNKLRELKAEVKKLEKKLSKLEENKEKKQ